MRSTLSERIVAFLTNMAHFQHKEIDGKFAAERITDGTLFLPYIDLDGDDGLDLIRVRWQGNPSNESEVSGLQIAEHEIIVAVKHWVAVGDMDDERSSTEHLFRHFAFKTGARLRFEKENREFSKTLEKLMKDLGWSAFKKFFGL